MDYVGIDLHKNESQICVITSAGRTHEKRIKTDRERFADTLPKMVAAGSRILVEASTESVWVAKVLRELGYDVIVADPNYAAMYGRHSKRKVKTDRRDAIALAEACKNGVYRVAHEPSPEAHRRRNLLTSRDQLVKMRAGCITTSRSLLRQYNYRITTRQAESYAAWARKLGLPDEIAAAIDPMLAAIDALSAQIAALDERIETIVKSDERVRRLTTVFGVGPITALAFEAAIEDTKRFKNAHRAEAYLGLVPGEDSSGDGTRRTGITKTGPNLVRWLLVQAALVIMRVGKSRAPGLHAWVHAVAQRRGSKIARVALARRLAGILFAMLRDKTTFDAARFAPQSTALTTS